MKHRILVIDDQSTQVESIKKALSLARPGIFVDTASKEKDILSKISDTYFNIALVDLRMDSFEINGFSIIRDIIEINPFAKIIVSSAYLTEYSSDINEIIRTGRIAAILDKTKFDVYIKNLLGEIDKIISESDEESGLSKRTLEFLFSEAKNDTEKFSKGTKFEYFTSALFSQMGFNHISTRVKDKSLNEVDLLVRNDLKDTFFQKFKPYFLVECKNTIENVDKNTFITFYSKLENTNGLANLGFIITTSGFKRTAYLEAMRTSNKENKIVFLSNSEISQLIASDEMIDGLKKIIDQQVKDN